MRVQSSWLALVIAIAGLISFGGFSIAHDNAHEVVSTVPICAWGGTPIEVHTIVNQAGYLQFEPQNVSVPSGGLIKWVNMNPPPPDGPQVTHTTSENQGEWIGTMDNVVPGFDHYTVAFCGATTWNYQCDFHYDSPHFMVGTVTVT